MKAIFITKYEKEYPILPDGVFYETGKMLRELDPNGNMVEYPEIAGGYTVLDSNTEDGKYKVIVDSNEEMIMMMKKSTKYKFVCFVEE